MGHHSRKSTTSQLKDHCKLEVPEGLAPQAYDCVLFGKCDCAVTEVASTLVAPVVFIGTGNWKKKQGIYRCLVCGTEWDQEWLNERTEYVHRFVPGRVDELRKARSANR